MNDPRRHAPATVRNRDPIIAVLRDVLPQAGLVLEIASGTGEHAIAFAAAFPGLNWQPTDPHEGALQSIAAHAADAGLANVQPPLMLDAAAPSWPIPNPDAIVCINMVHISPWEATLGLLDGAARLLPADGPLYLYGPYLEDDVPLAPSNADFDADLRARNANWGLRRRDDLVAAAGAKRLRFDQRISMPANNLSLIFRRS